jgi:hypothetical protein
MYPGQVTRLSEARRVSANSIDANYDVLLLSGATAIQTIAPRQLMGAQFLVLIPLDGTIGLLNTGNIIAAQTMLQNRATVLVYSRLLGKWYPQPLA